MNQYVTDTHSLLWHLSTDTRLSIKAHEIFCQADSGIVAMIVPSIVLVETIYLAEKKRIASNLIDELLSRLARKQYPYQLAQIDVETIRALRTIERKVLPDMPDRIIAATAKRFDLPVISKDGKFPDVLGLRIVWK